MSLLSQESEPSCIGVLGVSILRLSMIYQLYFGTPLTMWYSLFVILLIHYNHNQYYFSHHVAVSFIGGG